MQSFRWTSINDKIQYIKFELCNESALTNTQNYCRSISYLYVTIRYDLVNAQLHGPIRKWAKWRYFYFAPKDWRQEMSGKARSLCWHYRKFSLNSPTIDKTSVFFHRKIARSALKWISNCFFGCFAGLLFLRFSRTLKENSLNFPRDFPEPTQTSHINQRRKDANASKFISSRIKM